MGFRVGFDGKRAVRNSTGLGNYSRLAVYVLSRFYPENEYVVYSPVPNDNKYMAMLLEHTDVTLATPDTRLGRMFPSAWRVGQISRQLVRDRVDIYHGLSNELPLNIEHFDIPTVVTIHDVIFRRYPEYYKPIDRAIYDYKFRKAAERATRVIAISQCTARDIVHFYGIDPAKIDVVYQGCHEQFSSPVTDADIERVLTRYGIRSPYIVGVGTIERRKNQMLTLRALSALPRDISLVLVGRDNGYLKEITAEASRLGLLDRLKIIDHVEFTDLPALYSGAVMASYPSRYEGFGIPVIEAISSGTPIIVATGSCLEEASGPAMPAVDPDDTEAFIDAASRIISDSSYRDSIVAAGQQYIKKFNPADMARGIMDTYRKCL